MHNDSPMSFLFAAVTCLTPFLIASIIVAIKVRSVATGFKLFSLFAMFIGTASAVTYLYETFVPAQIQKDVYLYSFLFASVIIVALVGLYRYNAWRGGEIFHTEQRPASSKTIFAIGMIFVLLFITPFLSLNLADSSAFIVLLVFTISMVVRRFFSMFEIRAAGFVTRGNFIQFSNIEHAEWENLMKKHKLRLRLKGKRRAATIKTPWELITPIDDYIKTNFPRP